jgi:hypothetical protein
LDDLTCPASQEAGFIVVRPAWRTHLEDQILGINPKTLTSRMQRLDIQRNKKNA